MSGAFYLLRNTLQGVKWESEMTQTGPNDAWRVVWVLSFYLLLILVYKYNIILVFYHVIANQFLGSFYCSESDQIWSDLSGTDQILSSSEQNQSVPISSAQIWWVSAKYWTMGGREKYCIKGSKLVWCAACRCSINCWRRLFRCSFRIWVQSGPFGWRLRRCLKMFWSVRRGCSGLIVCASNENSEKLQLRATERSSRDASSQQELFSHG